MKLAAEAVGRVGNDYLGYAGNRLNPNRQIVTVAARESK